MTIDDQIKGESTSVTGKDLTLERLAEAVQGLDGKRQTLVMLGGPGEAHMGIGGDARQGLIVYATLDNRSFHQLVADDHNLQGRVRVVAGGQPGEYNASEVIDVDTALTAARAFAMDGTLDRGLVWRET